MTENLAAISNPKSNFMKLSQKYRHSRVHSSHYDLDGLAESTTPPNFEKRQGFIKKLKKEILEGTTTPEEAIVYLRNRVLKN